jgi:quercetin dioxygenase-like cupin family protein
MTFFIGDIVYELNEGDSVYFNSDLPHAMKATNGKPCKFLAIVMKGDI